MTSSPKPDIQWTDAQLRAIEERRGEVVVSASAGSGKTAVLTERVLRIITERDPETGGNPAALESLLIITFTEKATRQMRERIEAELRRRLDADEDNALLREALDKLPEAWIMTIDAFCQRIVRENFHQAGLSPGARIPDEAEAAELELRLLRELLDKRARESAAARGELEALLRAENGIAENLIAELRGLIGFLNSLDHPEHWVRAQRERLRLTLAAQAFGDLPDALAAYPEFQRETRELIDALENLLAQVRERWPREPALMTWTAHLNELHALVSAPPPFAPDAVRAEIAAMEATLGKLNLQRVCGKIIYADESFRERTLRGFCKFFNQWRERWLALDEAGWLFGAQIAAQRLLALLGLAEAAQTSIEQHKRRRGLVTFNDFERLALQLLEDGDKAPTAIAYELQQRFEYVLVDEYQDTSPLQDALIKQVSRGAGGGSTTRGNLFVVGDVKQSIYRFRHAEPALFKARIDAARGANECGTGGLYGINLLENFRSRAAILDFVNACFVRLMDESVGELNYDEREALKAGRIDSSAAGESVAIEIQWLPKQVDPHAGAADGNDNDNSDENENSENLEGAPSPPPNPVEILRGIEAQAAWVAARIRALTDQSTGQNLPDEAEPHGRRRARPGDCAILLRGLRGELDAWLTALSREGLRVRAPGIDPLFSAPELVDLLNALRAADNPFQDMPLAALLRSPLFEFSDEELLRIRLAQRQGTFHEAVWKVAAETAASAYLSLEFIAKCRAAVERIGVWSALARTRPADAVLEAILLQTGYEAWLTGLADAAQRLEHIDYLRGLLRRLGRPDGAGTRGANALAVFLELIDRAEEESGSLGDLPESLAGADDAVNLLTIHKSKGLEFPIVFLPRLERKFRDPRSKDVLFDLQAGIAARGIDMEKRRLYPTLGHERLAGIRRRKERSEELRLLYVAMTRARERLILLGQPVNIDKARGRWSADAAAARAAKPLSVLERLHAASAAELLGPIAEALSREHEYAGRLALDYADTLPAAPQTPQKRTGILEALACAGQAGQALRLRAAEELEREAAAQGSAATPVAAFKPRLLPAWEAAPELARLAAKTTVTALRAVRAAEPKGEAWREEQAFENEDEARRPVYSPIVSLEGIAPDFALEGKSAAALDPMLRGTLHHQLLANLDLKGDLSAEGLHEQAAELVRRGILIGASLEHILSTLDFEAMAWFFTTELGQTMIERAGSVVRELPFTMRRPAAEFGASSSDEFVLVQGMIDVVLDMGDSALIVDYKTDRIYREGQIEELTAQYKLQLGHYVEALKGIWGLSRVWGWLVFLDCSAGDTTHPSQRRIVQVIE